MMRPGIDYGVEVVTAYQQRRVGQVFHPPALLRDALLRRGIVKRVTAPPAAEAAEATAVDKDSSGEKSGRKRRKSESDPLI